MPWTFHTSCCAHVPTSGPSQFNPTNKDDSTKNNSQDKPTDSAALGSSACSEQARDDENNKLEELILLTPAA
ncbi:hypothetical protein PCANC_03142 [Puccinia coronata f. sp. avenae]|uniref:Uncharacterized protein n=1 Tax=Puccinia coronata f. sp. avenae TaxID=200324 RepID=A0A2N5T846_9BASI|nr:hypothetical protein PCANC_03142 [Puccinia coronata f. sp. avenae]